MFTALEITHGSCLAGITMLIDGKSMGLRLTLTSLILVAPAATIGIWYTPQKMKIIERA
jgi:hypothetical protein